MHGGAAPQVRAVAARRLQRERLDGDLNNLLSEMELEAPSPIEGLLEAYRIAFGMTRVLRMMVGDLTVPSAQRLAAPEPWHAGGIHGPNHLGDGAPHVLVDMLGTWTDRLARTTKLMLDAGIEQRQVELTERQGEQLAAVLRGTAAALIALVLNAVPGVERQRLERSLFDALPAILSEQIRTVQPIDATESRRG